MPPGGGGGGFVGGGDVFAIGQRSLNLAENATEFDGRRQRPESRPFGRRARPNGSISYAEAFSESRAIGALKNVIGAWPL